MCDFSPPITIKPRIQVYVKPKIQLNFQQGKGQKTPCLTVECSERWTLVSYQNNKPWLWLALEKDSRRMVEWHIGAHSKKGTDTLGPIYGFATLNF